MTDSRIAGMLFVLCAATFAVTSSGTATAPFLQAISDDLATTLPAIANLFAVQAITWGLAALVAGAFLAQRFGRRTVLIVAALCLGGTRLGFAASHSYQAVVIWQLVSGVCGGAFMGTVFAAVSDHVPAGTRGRALSWIITGQSLSIVLGVPLVTLMGLLGGWRGAFAVQGAVTIAIAIVVRFAVPPDTHRQNQSGRTPTPWRRLLQPKLVALMAAGTTERVCFATLAIYLPTYLQRAYGLSFAPLALALCIVALGNLAGNVFGGRIADRARSRGAVFAGALVLTAALAIPTLMWQPGIAISVTLGFAYSFVNALGRPSLMATLSDMPSDLRGALFGLNVTMASIGWLLAGSLGGWLIAAAGFVGIGTFCGVIAVLGAGLALASVPARLPVERMQIKPAAKS